MKRIVFSLLVIFIFFSCVKEDDNQENDFGDVAVINIRDSSEFDLMVGLANSSDYLFIKAYEGLNKPKTVLINSEEFNKRVFIDFHEDGMIDRITVDGYKFVIRNTNGKFFDAGIISPSGEIEILRNLESKFDWSSNMISRVSLSQSIDWKEVLLGKVSDKIDAMPCVLAAINTKKAILTGGVELPFTIFNAFECGVNIGEIIGNYLYDNGVRWHFLEDIYPYVDGFF